MVVPIEAGWALGWFLLAVVGVAAGVWVEELVRRRRGR